MKNVKFLAVAFTALSLNAFMSCNSNDVSLTGVKLDRTSVSVAVGETVTLVATAEPAGATATFEWKSSNTDIATVADGVVTGVAKGSTYILVTADGYSANCLVTVTDASGGGGDDKEYACLKGSNYYLFIMDETTASSISSKTVGDYRVNDSSILLYIWPSGDSYAAGTCSGTNFFGQVADWYCLTAQASPWSGVGAGGICLVGTTADLTAIDGTYTFHAAYKSTDNGQNEICVFSADGSETWITLPAKDDGAWHEYEISMSDLFSKGVSYNAVTPQANNVLGIRTTGTGKTLNLDACFIYKK